MSSSLSYIHVVAGEQREKKFITLNKFIFSEKKRRKLCNNPRHSTNSERASSCLLSSPISPHTAFTARSCARELVYAATHSPAARRSNSWLLKLLQCTFLSLPQGACNNNYFIAIINTFFFAIARVRAAADIWSSFYLQQSIGACASVRSFASCAVAILIYSLTCARYVGSRGYLKSIIINSKYEIGRTISAESCAWRRNGK